MNNKTILEILKSLAVNYPVLHSFGMQVPRALILVVDRDQGSKAAEALRVFSGSRIDCYASPSKMRKILTETNSEFVLYVHSNSEKSLNFLRELLAIAQSGFIDGQELSAPVLVVSEGVPYGISAADGLFVYADGLINDTDIPVEFLVPPATELALVREEMKKSEEGDVFHAAACCICLCFQNDKDKESIYAEFCTTAEQMFEASDDCSGTGDLCEAFLKTLHTWREDENFESVFELPYLPEEAISNIDSIIVYDDERIYFSEKLFRKIIEPLDHVVNRQVLTRALVEAGILLPERHDEASSVLPVKVGFYDDEDRYQRKRMLRFSRTKLSQPGTREFISACLDEKKRRDVEC